MVFEFRAFDPSIKTDSRMGVPIHRYSRIEEVPWLEFAQQPNVPVRIIVQSRETILPLDVLYIPRENKRLLVGLHGAEFGNKDLPKFQFVRSFTNSRKESLLFISDSTHLHSPGEIGISWYAGDPAINISIAYSNLILVLNRAIGIEETILVGHSAGGTGAIKIGARIPNSRAIAVNSQFSAGLYPKWALAPLLKSVFPRAQTSDELLEKYPDRFDLAYALDNRVKGATISWFSHIDDASSFAEYPNFDRAKDYFGLSGYGGNSPQGDAVVACNWEAPPNAHALPVTVIPYIEATLGEKVSIDLKPLAEVNLSWKR